MSTVNAVIKETTIKFSVSPKFKSLVQAKASQKGLSLADLGRMLFGVYVHSDTFTTKSSALDMLVSEGQTEYERGLTKSIQNQTELKNHLRDLQKTS